MHPSEQFRGKRRRVRGMEGRAKNPFRVPGRAPSSASDNDDTVAMKVVTIAITAMVNKTY